MFFSPELLARRDSGFGLLWLAATLGSKSAFKKLPKRSVLTADITQLCGLIVDPAEPLALRLSSNLMIGVARVYKVKQEIFMTDVTNCVASLKKVVQELQSAASKDARLQMVQPTIRSSALTLNVDQRNTLALDFDALVADWDEYLNIGAKGPQGEDTSDLDDEYKPTSKGNRKGKPKQLPLMEAIRGDPHTLTEHHDHLLTTSFDSSFNGGGIDPSSSLVDPDFIFDDNFFAPSDGLDVGGILGDELAQELGEGWGGAPVNHVLPETDFNRHQYFDKEFSVDPAFDCRDMLNDVEMSHVVDHYTNDQPNIPSDSDKNNSKVLDPCPSLIPDDPSSPATAFSRLLLSQDTEQPLMNDIYSDDQNRLSRKHKRTRLLLDARTELTDDELKTARSQYLQAQELLRRNICNKRWEKDSGRIIEEIVWGVPQGIQAQALVDFWQENFKVQVEARSGAVHVYLPDEPPKKRRKTGQFLPIDADVVIQPVEAESVFDQDFQLGIGLGGDYFDAVNFNDGLGHPRSSEEPGQGRRISRPPSVIGSGNFRLDQDALSPQAGSQRSSLFPWDNAGASSSSGIANPLGESDNMAIQDLEVKLVRGSSQSRSLRGSSLVPSQLGSMISGLGVSPAHMGRSSQVIGEDFAFDVDQLNNSMAAESQQSEFNLVSLERNSFNFLEYAKMQNQALPGLSATLPFDVVVPTLTSTRHVAAAAFYHCLVLATKNFIHLQQTESYGVVSIGII